MTVALYRAVGAVLSKQGLRVGPGRRRGRLRAAAPRQRAGVRDRRRRDSPLRLRAGPRRGDRRRRGLDPLLRPGDGHLPPAAPAATSARRRGHDRPAGRLGRALSDRLARGRPGRGRLGRLDRAHRAAWASPSSSSATTCSPPRSPGFATGIDRRAGNAILIKLNQVGTLTETFDAICAGPDARLPHGRLGPLGRDRGCDDRRPGRRHRRRPDQDRLGGALGAAGQVQPAAADRGGAGRPGAVFPVPANIFSRIRDSSAAVSALLSDDPQ